MPGITDILSEIEEISETNPNFSASFWLHLVFLMILCAMLGWGLSELLHRRRKEAVKELEEENEKLRGENGSLKETLSRKEAEYGQLRKEIEQAERFWAWKKAASGTPDAADALHDALITGERQ